MKKQHSLLSLISFLLFFLSGCAIQRVNKVVYTDRPSVCCVLRLGAGASYAYDSIINALKNIFITHGYFYVSSDKAEYCIDITVEKIDTIETIVSYDTLVQGAQKRVLLCLVVKKNGLIVYESPLCVTGFVHRSDDLLWSDRYEKIYMQNIYKAIAVRIESIVNSYRKK